MAESTLTLSPAAVELADSIAEHSVNHPAPGKLGAVPAILAGMTASGAALFLEGLFTDYLGDTAKALIESEHNLIAAFVAPRFADLAAATIAEFGTQGGR